MLVLARNVGQKILIDQGRIVVTLVEVRGEKVRLGIEAPDDVDIIRDDARKVQHTFRPMPAGDRCRICGQQEKVEVHR